MRSVRVAKVMRDLWVARGRMALMVAALGTSLLVAGATLGGYAIMSREMNRAYLATLPASATLDTERVTPELLAAARALPNVQDVEARATVQGRVRVGQDWRPLVLFVVPDFQAMRMSRVEPVRGAWPPPAGTFLVERVALSVLEAEPGDAVMVKPPHAPATSLTVSGVVYDAAVAPATMERTVYGYISPETLAGMGETGGLDELKLLVTQGGEQTDVIERTSAQVAAWLQAQGRAVHAISVPPPRRHPHQGQMNAIMLLLNGFSLVSLVLSGILVASVMAALMARQSREIGVLKAVGGSTAQVAVMYGGMVALLGLAAAVLAVLPGMLGARLLAGIAAQGLNIALASTAVPAWVVATQLGAGVLVPLAMALVPVAQGARRPVQVALTTVSTSLRPLPAWVFRLGGSGLGTPVRLGLRNALRNRSRLLVNVALLAFGGALFITAANVRAGWNTRLAEVGASRLYDLEVQFQRPARAADLEALLQSVPGVRRVEAWGMAPAAPGALHGPPLNHAYPDRGHGVFRVLGAPPETTLVRLPLLEGRWLEASDQDGVVLNHLALVQFPEAHVGSTVVLTESGVPVQRRVVGVVRDLGSPATAYVVRDVRTDGQRLVRVQLQAGSAGERARTTRAVQEALDGAGLAVTQVVAVGELKTAIGEHMSVLLGVLVALAALMTLVGALGLAAATVIAVVERTRELGVLQAVGATPETVQTVLVVEGVLVGALSALLASVLALPLSWGMGRLLGSMAFRVPLPLVVSPLAVSAWLVGVLLLAAAATAVPARTASRMSVREALAYV